MLVQGPAWVSPLPVLVQLLRLHVCVIVEDGGTPDDVEALRDAAVYVPPSEGGAVVQLAAAAAAVAAAPYSACEALATRGRVATAQTRFALALRPLVARSA